MPNIPVQTRLGGSRVKGIVLLLNFVCSFNCYALQAKTGISPSQPDLLPYEFENIRQTGIRLDRYLSIGPFSYDRGCEQEGFDEDYLAPIGGESSTNLSPVSIVYHKGKYHSWTVLSDESAIIHFEKSFHPSNHAVVYACAVIRAPDDQTIFLLLRSDDAAKTWLNGTKILDHAVYRTIASGYDVLPLHLKRGRNQLLFKILNGTGEWLLSSYIRSGHGLLMEASEYGDAPLVESLLDLGVDPNEADTDGYTPLHVAAHRGHLDTVKLLLKRGAKIRAVARDGLTPYLEAVLSRDESSVAELKDGRSGSARFPHDLTRAIDVLCRRSVPDGGPGIAIGVLKNGEIIFKGCYGNEDIERHRAISPTTQFSIGSISKPLLAMAVIHLIEKKTIMYSSSVRNFIPELPQYLSAVTIEQLLDHTSGLPAEMGSDDKHRPYESWPEFLESIERMRRLRHAPGEEFEYSNVGYTLLSVVLERASGLPISEAMKQLLFDPLKMVDSLTYDAFHVPRNLALSYSEASQGYQVRWADYATSNVHRVRNDWDVVSTLNDMVRLVSAISRREYLRRDSWAKILGYPQEVEEHGNQKTNSLGWFRWGVGNNTYLGHSGAHLNFSSSIVCNITANLSMVVLTNFSPSDPEGLANDVDSLSSNLRWPPQ